MSVSVGETEIRDAPGREPAEPVLLGENHRRGGVAVELVLAMLVAGTSSLAILWLVDRLNLPADSEVPAGLSTVAIAALTAFTLYLVARRAWPAWATVASWALPGALSTVWLSFTLAGSSFYLGGVSWDQTTRTQYLTRLTDSAALADLNYADLPPFYPAGWFWLGGRFANLTGLEGWQAYKPFAIMTAAVAVGVAFVLWSRIVRRRVALVLAVATMLVGVRGADYEVYSWLVIALLPPVAVLAFRGLRAAALGERRGWGSTVGAGVFLGVSGAVYSLVFGFFLAVLLVLAAGALAPVWLRHRDGVARWPATGRVALRLGCTGLVAAPLVLLVWTPYLLALLEGRGGPGSALRFLPEESTSFPLPMLEFTLIGVLSLAGACWILLRWRRSATARVLGAVVLTCYGWYLLSNLALAGQLTLLAFRTEPVLDVSLLCAAALGGIELAGWAAKRWPDLLAAAPALPADRTPRGRRNVLAGALALCCVVALTQTAKETQHGNSLREAFDDYDLSGHDGWGAADPAEAGYWNRQLIAAIDDLTGRPASELTVLTTHYRLLAFRPYHGFQTTIAGWANPLADFAGRAAEIDSWARARTPGELTEALRTSPYGAPDVFVLANAGEKFQLELTYDTFPRKNNIGQRTVSFDPDAFAGPAFEWRDVGPFTVLARTS